MKNSIYEDKGDLYCAAESQSSKGHNADSIKRKGVTILTLANKVSFLVKSKSNIGVLEIHLLKSSLKCAERSRCL